MAIAVGTRTRDKIEETDKRDKERIIDGLFYELWSDNVAQFTGVFHYSKGEDSNAIEGLLEDCCGRSRIEGLLSEQKTLSFDKLYGGRINSIEYKFSFDKENGLYIGAWKGKDVLEGYSVCKLDNQLVQPDVNFILEYFKSFDAMSIEDKTRVIMGDMVSKGYLNVSRDSSGELMVSLSEDGKKLAEEAEKTITPEEKKLVDEAVNIVNTLMQGDQPDEDIPF